MEGAKSFDTYEVVGVIAPGVVVTLLLALENPALRSLLGKDGLSVGGPGPLPRPSLRPRPSPSGARQRP